MAATHEPRDRENTAPGAPTRSPDAPDEPSEKPKATVAQPERSGTTPHRHGSRHRRRRHRTKVTPKPASLKWWHVLLVVVVGVLVTAMVISLVSAPDSVPPE